MGTRYLIYVTLGILSFYSCQKDIYNPNSIKRDFFIQNIPAGFDWSNSSSIAIEITPGDTYGGKYFYTIEVFGQNPLLYPQPPLFAKGVCKADQPFRITAAIPNTQSTVFIRQTDPSGKKKIMIAEMNGAILKCSFLPNNNQLLSRAGVGVKNNDYNIDDSEFEITPIPQDVKEFNPQSSFTANQAYILRGNYVGTIDFPWGGNNTLFIEGIWTNTAAFTQLPNNTKIVVLANGKVKTDKQWNIESSPGSQIEIASGGTWGQETDARISLILAGATKFINKGTLHIEKISTNTNNVRIYNNGNFTVQGDITFQNQGELINRGELHAKNIQIRTSNSNLYNSGVLIVDEQLQTQNSGIVKNIRFLKVNKLSLLKTEFINTDTVIAQTLTTEQTKLYNYSQIIVVGNMTLARNSQAINECRIVVRNELRVEQTELTLTNNTSISSQKLFVDGSKINLNSFSMLAVEEEAQFTSQLNNIQGDGNDYALFRAPRIEWYQKSANHLNIKGNLEIDCPDFDENGKYDKYYNLQGTAYFAQNGSSIKIEAEKCTGEGNNTGTDQPENPTFPIPVHLTGMNYTWIVEDVYPKLGDYDMNDAVIKIDSMIVMLNAENKVANLTLHTTLRAVGGVIRTGAALQLEQIAPSAINNITRSSNITLSGDIFKVGANGTEEGQSKAVIPLFDNAHSVMGVSNTRTMINTVPIEEEGSTEKPEQNMVTNITFTTPIELNHINDIRQLNFFAVISDKPSDRGVEIHLPLYAHTDKSNTPGQVQESTNKLMWSLFIPGDFKYALEKNDIRKAYPQFQEWIQSNKQKYQDWYEHPDTRYTYKK